MSRKIIALIALASVLALAGCINHKVKNPMAGIDSKQPDKGLFDNAIKAMRHGQNQEARTLLQTLLNTYPDSEYIARAKLAIGDSWYAEGGTTAWAQAVVEYKDFQVFYPNMPEAAEAQLKVATIHYRQMEKPDRDFVQAQRAADEYKALIQQYPDSSLVPEAKQRLREVQEVLADRQYRIANFYYLRDNIAAAQARLQSLIDSYPLYSGIDQALFDLGTSYEREAANIRRQPRFPASLKETMAAEYQKHAIEAYKRIITRYPAMHRAGDARKRLQALNEPVPTPTAEAIAESKAEEQSRHSLSRTQKVMANFRKHPTVARAPGVGEPNMNEEEQTSAPALVQDLTKRVAAAAVADNGLSLTTVGSGTGTPGANQPPPGTTGAQPAAGSPAGTNGASPGANGTGSSASPSPAAPGAGERSSVSTTPSTGDGAPPTPAPGQTNEIPKATSDTQAAQNGTAQSSQQQSSSDTKQDSSSKKKTKKGLRKLIPF
jgi:outer membrane protein assembly factor BamD